jgi:uncharacterized membrane protein
LCGETATYPSCSARIASYLQVSYGAGASARRALHVACPADASSALLLNKLQTSFSSQQKEESMSALKALTAAAVALFVVAGPAAAVTVKNTSGKEVSIGVDYGNKSEVKKIGAGKSVTFDCKDDCGVTGPWGFSWMASGDDTMNTNGKSLVTVNG